MQRSAFNVSLDCRWGFQDEIIRGWLESSLPLTSIDSPRHPCVVQLQPGDIPSQTVAKEVESAGHVSALEFLLVQKFEGVLHAEVDVVEEEYVLVLLVGGRKFGELGGGEEARQDLVLGWDRREQGFEDSVP